MLPVMDYPRASGFPPPQYRGIACSGDEIALSGCLAGLMATSYAGSLLGLVVAPPLRSDVSQFMSGVV